jgi:hypothetical protein
VILRIAVGFAAAASRTVIVGEVDFLPVVAALRDARQDDASKPRQGRILRVRVGIAKVIGDCPEWPLNRRVRQELHVVALACIDYFAGIVHALKEIWVAGCYSCS